MYKCTLPPALPNPTLPNQGCACGYSTRTTRFTELWNIYTYIEVYTIPVCGPQQSFSNQLGVSSGASVGHFFGTLASLGNGCLAT